MRKYGFTLAEVLITLGVIGIVSAMTIPSLLSNHKKKTFGTKLEKEYSVVSNAFAQMIADSNATDLTETEFDSLNKSDCNTMTNFMGKYFKIIKTECGTNKTYKSGYRNYTMYTPWSVAFADGAQLHYYNYLHNVYTFILDLNGWDRPNTYGTDVFYLYIIPDGSIVDGGFPSAAKTSLQNYTNVCATSSCWMGRSISDVMNKGWVLP